MIHHHIKGTEQSRFARSYRDIDGRHLEARKFHLYRKPQHQDRSTWILCAFMAGFLLSMVLL